MIFFSLSTYGYKKYNIHRKVPETKDELADWDFHKDQ